MSRHQTNDDRDLAHRKERQAAPDKPWHEEPTGVHTDTQVFRAIKGLRDELQDSKVQAANAHGALKAEVAALSGRVAKQDEKLDSVTRTVDRMDGKLDVMLADRRPAATTQQRTVAVAVETLLTDKVNEQQHKRERVTIAWRAIASFIGSPAVVAGAVAIVAAWFAGRGC